jgi:hypothetical protein
MVMNLMRVMHPMRLLPSLASLYSEKAGEGRAFGTCFSPGSH